MRKKSNNVKTDLSMINSRKYMMGTKLLQTKGTWYWDGPTCMSALIVICKRNILERVRKFCLAMGLQQHFAWQRASTKLCLAKGLQQNIAWQWDFNKICLVTGLQQSFAWKRAFNKTLPGNRPSTKFA